MKLTQEESRALAFIAAMILLSILGRWADRPQPLRGNVVAVNLDSLEAASSALAKKGSSKEKKVAEPPKPAALSSHVVQTTPAHLSAGASQGGNPPLIDLNTATAAELETLPGVGPVLAQRIVAYRDSAGRFANMDALLAVKGVGPAMMKRVRPLLRTP